MSKSCNKPEPFTKQDLEDACDLLGTCTYFRVDMRASVMMLLARMCLHKEALKWLISEQVNRVGVWHGPAELRGILCSRYEAADGIDYWSTLPGYRAEDAEARYLATLEEKKQISAAPAAEYHDMIRQLAAKKSLLPSAKEIGSSYGNNT